MAARPARSAGQLPTADGTMDGFLVVSPKAAITRARILLARHRQHPRQAKRKYRRKLARRGFAVRWSIPITATWRATISPIFADLHRRWRLPESRAPVARETDPPRRLCRGCHRVVGLALIDQTARDHGSKGIGTQGLLHGRAVHNLERGGGACPGQGRSQFPWRRAGAAR